MRRIGMIMFFCLALHPVSGQQIPDLEAVMRLTGAASVEDLDPYEVERLEDLLRTPLRINQVSLSRLKESGLLTHYQAVALTDYRSRHGDVLSFSELASVDGFGKDFVERTAPFISLESRSLPGSTTNSSATSHEITLRTSLKAQEQKLSSACGFRYRLDAAGRFSAGLALSKTYEQRKINPKDMCVGLRWDFKRYGGKVLAGDFNARFGQGLALWNGMGLGGIISPSAFMKRPSGLGQSSSFTGSYAMRGFAADLSLGRFRLSSLLAMNLSEKGFAALPGLNVTWYGKEGSVGLTHYADLRTSYPRPAATDMKTSVDLAFCRDGVDLFGEFAYDWVNSSVAALSGIVFPAGENLRFAAMLRYYPASYSPARSAAAKSVTKCTNEHSVSLAAEAAGERHSVAFSADLAYLPEPKDDDHLHDMQLKANAEWTVMATSALKIKLRASEKFRTWGRRFRTEASAEFSYVSGPWTTTLRMDAVRSAKTGFLSYFEGSYKTDKTALYMRLGAFFIDEWDDRIYSYERDAPGSFNVPAYYGRGVWTALAGSWKFARWGRIYCRAGYTGYPFMEKKKPGKAELKLQLMFDI